MARSDRVIARAPLAVLAAAVAVLSLGCAEAERGIVDPGRPNRAPVVRGPIWAQTIPVGRSVGLELSWFFADPDGETLAYEATSSNPGVAGLSVAGSWLTMEGMSRGVATGTVVARDGERAEARQSFELTVCALAPEGILHHWAGEGTGADLIGDADATLMNGAGYAEGVPGAGTAFSFDGVDAIARVPDAPTLNPKGPFSVMAWAKPGPGEASGSGTVIGKGHPWKESWELDNHNGRWRTFIRDGSEQDVRVYGPRLVAGEWTHLAMTWDGDRLAFYVNAVRQGTSDVGSIHVNDVFVGIGARSEEGFADEELDLEFTGAIDEVMFFGRALDEGEIRSVFDSTTFGPCNP